MAGRRDFLKGLMASAALTPLAGHHVVSAGELVVPGREIIVPEAQQIIVTKELPRPVTLLRAHVTQMQVSTEPYYVTGWNDNARGYLPGPVSVEFSCILTDPGDGQQLRRAYQALQSRRALPVYFDVSGGD